MFEDKKVKIAMNIAFIISATGAAIILHNAPASATLDSNGLLETTYDTVNGSQRATLSGQAKAVIISQITSATAGILDFGKIAPTVLAGTVTVDANGNITNSGGARYIPGSNAHVAILAFSGQPGQNIAITTQQTVTITNGANSMDVSFLYPTLPTIIGSDGFAGMSYGGTLNVGANQAPGIYSGTYDIFVTYVS